MPRKPKAKSAALVRAVPARSAPSISKIHPSAVVEKGAKLGAGCEIGPFCHVGPHVVLGDRVEEVGPRVIRDIQMIRSPTVAAILDAYLPNRRLPIYFYADLSISCPPPLIRAARPTRQLPSPHHFRFWRRCYKGKAQYSRK